jgi:Mg-chelatase subunit ChlD
LSDPAEKLAVARWRLVLGRYADPGMADAFSDAPGYGRMDAVLDYLYGREYRGRGARDAESRQGGMGASVLQVPEWVRQVRDLFPRDTVEIIERHALDRYEMTELVTDPEILNKLEPNYELLKAVLTFRGMMQGEVLGIANRIVRQTIADLKRKLARDVRQVLWGRLNRQQRSRLKVAGNFDWRRTIRKNLKNYDADRRRIVVEDLFFFSRIKRHLPWHIIMAVDLSGSMMDSVIYSAVMAGIFNGLPAMKVSLFAFDTAIVDLTDRVDDPVDVLMSVQLGGGTDIAGALGYGERLVVHPNRTILLLVTDFFEGRSVPLMLGSIKRLREAGVKVLGLAALDEKAEPCYDHGVAQQCVAAGAEVAALTPRRLAEWLEKLL